MTDKNGSDTRTARKPTAFRLDDRNVRLSEESNSLPLSTETVIREEIDTDFAPAELSARPPAPKTSSFGRWIAIGFGGLVSLALGLAIDSLIRDLFLRAEWLGWAGLALAGLAVLGILGLMIREAGSLMRLRKIDDLRTHIQAAADTDDAKAARRHLGDLANLYADRPDTARGRKALQIHMSEVIDGRDLVMLAERDLLAPLDKEARRIVMSSAKRVSLVTAISPRAIVDLLAVLFENLRIIRQLSHFYGGRPGTLGFLRLTRHVLQHLAVTGGMAAGDSLASQVLGHGLAARLSARLGEGVINGLLTARVGIAAISVCRPAPFVASKGPSVSEFMNELVSSAEKEEAPKGKKSS